jgi:hypothetical protein
VIPAFVLQQAAPEGVQPLLSTFKMLAEGQEPDDQELLAFSEGVVANLEALRTHFTNWRRHLIDWLAERLEIHISPEDAGALAEEFVNLAEREDEETLAAEIKTFLEKRGNEKLRNDIKDLWKDRTDTASPREWSDMRGVPLGFVIDDKDFQQAIERVFDHQWIGNEEELQQTMDRMRNSNEFFKTLCDQDACDDAFLDCMCPELKPLLVYKRGESAVSDLKQRLRSAVSDDVHDWPLNMPLLNREIDDWIYSYYDEVIFPEFRRRIREADNGSAKEMLLTISEDARVGSALLKRCWGPDCREDGRSDAKD